MKHDCWIIGEVEKGESNIRKAYLEKNLKIIEANK